MMERKYGFSKICMLFSEDNVISHDKWAEVFTLAPGQPLFTSIFDVKTLMQMEEHHGTACPCLCLHVLLNTWGIVKSKLYGCYKRSFHSLALQRQPFRLAFSLDTSQWASQIKRVATIVFTCKICSRQANEMSIMCLH